MDLLYKELQMGFWEPLKDLGTGSEPATKLTTPTGSDGQTGSLGIQTNQISQYVKNIFDMEYILIEIYPKGILYITTQQK